MKRSAGRVAVLCALSLMFSASSAIAYSHMVNDDYTNTSIVTANDLHVTYVGTSPITISNQCCNSSAGGDATITGNGTTVVSLDWSGFSAGPGDTIHVGYYVTSNGPAIIKETFWTKNGAVVGVAVGRGHTPISGPTTGYVIGRVRYYADVTGAVELGRSYVQDQGTNVTVDMISAGQAFCASISSQTSVTQVAHVDLNRNNATLEAGFGAEGPIQCVGAKRPIPALSTGGLVAFGLLLLSAMAWVVYRRGGPTGDPIA